jgi:Bacterial Ig-like domain (group 3)
VAVDPPGSTHTDQLQRASLALDAGKVIIGYGGNDGDCGSYHGWLVAVPETGGSLQTFEVDGQSGGSQGAIWGAGNAPAVDSAGDIWTSTGNGSSGSFGYQESVIKLDSNLNVLGFWAPSNWSTLDSSDTEQASVCSGSWGGGIYDNVGGWTVNSNAVGPPIFAGGLVWSAGTGNGILYGLDPSSGATRFSANLGGFEHFTTPSAGGGRLFVADRTKVTAFQIAAAPGATTTTVGLSSSRNPVPAGQSVSYTATVSSTPDGGTVSFTDGGSAIPGCSGVVVSVSGQTSCTTRFARPGRRQITAGYSGDAYYAGSSVTLSQAVTDIVPVISRLRAKVVREKLRFSLILSKPVKFTVAIAKLVPGRRIHRRCRAQAKHGRRCMASLRLRILLLNGRVGHDGFRPRMRRLPPGDYAITVTARDRFGGRSKPRTVVVIVAA